MYNAYITRLKNVRPHPNAQKLQLADCFGNTVCVGLDMQENQLIVYFPTDGQLSEEFCAQHDLVRRKDDAGNSAGGYLDPDKRNIKTIRLRGESSDGLVMAIECLVYTGIDINTLTEGTPFTVINGHEICQKYIPRSNRRGQSCNTGNRTRKKKVPIAPLFQPHIDTAQLQYNFSAFKPGDYIEITEKLHGTSARIAYLPILKKYKRSLLDRILKKEGKPIYEWGYVAGTRRTVLENYEGGYYGSNAFREPHSKFFEGKLRKQETIYGEIVGFTEIGIPIMPSCENSKIKDKNFTLKYGKTTIFSYGCAPEGKKKLYGNDDLGPFEIDTKVPQSKFYIYRITSINEDGDVIEYSPSQIRYRCEQMGAEAVPLLWQGFIPQEVENAGEWVFNLASQFVEGSSTLDSKHLREGVVVRIVNKDNFSAYKLKSFEFKVLENIIKDEAEIPDREEQEEIL